MNHDWTIDAIGNTPPEGAHVGGLLNTLYQSRRTIVAITAAFTLAGVAYAFLSAPVYQANLMIQVEENPNSPKNVLSDVSSMFAAKTAASGEIEVLSSRMVVSRAVDETRSYIEAAPRYLPVVGRWFADHVSSPSWSGFGGYAWGGERIAVSQFDVPAPLYDKPFVLTQDGDGRYTVQYDDIVLNGKVGEVARASTPYGGTIELRVDALSGRPGATFRLVRTSELSAIQAIRNKLQASELGKESDMIGAALEGTDPVGTAAILNAIARAYVRQNVQHTQEEAEKSIAFLDQQLPELKAKLQKAENEANKFRAAHGAVNLSAEATTLLQSSALAQTKVSTLQQQRAELMARFTPDNPALIAVDGELGVARKEVRDLSAQMQRLPLLEQEVLRLQREVQVDTNIYTNLLNTREQLRLLKAGRVSNVRLIDGAVVPEHPIRPKRAFAIAGALLTGLFASVSLVLLRRKISNGVAVIDEIECGTGLTVYATVPRSRVQEMLTRRLHENAGHNLVLAQTAMTDAAVESLRCFRDALEFSLRDAPNHIVLLAGPTPVVGKSFVSVNLATLLGASGRRVLLVDADLRRGSLHNHVGAASGPGVVDIVAEGRPFDEVVHRSILPGVDFVANGGHVGNASEILRHPNFLAFAQEADATYDVVLVDAPPILPVADSGIVAHLAGTVFLIARYGVTSVAELRESIRRFEQIGVPIRGVVFNDMMSRPGKYGSEYAAYGYGSYGSPVRPMPGAGPLGGR